MPSKSQAITIITVRKDHPISTLCVPGLARRQPMPLLRSGPHRLSRSCWSGRSISPPVDLCVPQYLLQFTLVHLHHVSSSGSDRPSQESRFYRLVLTQSEPIDRYVCVVRAGAFRLGPKRGVKVACLLLYPALFLASPMYRQYDSVTHALVFEWCGATWQHPPTSLFARWEKADTMNPAADLSSRCNG